MRLAVLLTCHNRVDITVESLSRLLDCKRPADVELEIWLNDDGSTDGTSERVKAHFPQVRVICGSGNDFWCGGMRRVWATASATKDYDGYLWLNDDTWLDEGGLMQMLTERDVLTVGSICTRDRKHASYGGMDATGAVMSPQGVRVAVCSFHGNCVYVPRHVFKTIGNFPPCWTHAMGDGDYARTALERGIKVEMTAQFVGTCNRNDKPAAWKRPDVPFFERLKNLYSPLSYGEPPKLFRYCLRHDGLAVAIKNFLTQHIRVCFPALWSIKPSFEDELK